MLRRPFLSVIAALAIVASACSQPAAAPAAAPATSAPAAAPATAAPAAPTADAAAANVAAAQTIVAADSAAADATAAAAPTAAPAAPTTAAEVATTAPVAAATTAPSAGGTIKIGLLYNVTGALSSIDGPALKGSQLAVKEINAKGGVNGMMIETVVYDGKSDVTTATNFASRLVETDAVNAIVGLTDTSFMLAAGPPAQNAGVPFLDVGGTAPIITGVGDYIFVLPFGDNTQAAVAAEFAFTSKSWKSTYMLMDKAWDYTRFLSKYYIDRYTELGGTIVAEDTYQSGDKDFSAQLTKIKNLSPQPDVVFISAVPDDIGTVIKQAREQGVTQPILGGDGYDTPLLVEVAGAESAQNVFFTTHLGVYGDDPAAKAFNAAYEAEYGNPPEAVFAALGYDGINLMADAIARAGSTEGAAVRDALAETEGYKGVTGEISYPATSALPAKSVALIEVKDGKFTLLDVLVPEKVPAP